MTQRAEGFGERLPRGFLERAVLDVAPDLLGRVVVHEDGDALVAVRLTEVEAYDGTNDPGSHAFRGATPRTQVMFGPAGHVYVYFTYGMHWCANVVSGTDGHAAAVLLRGGQVVAGEDVASSRRPTARADRDLARGPARLAAALGLTGVHSGDDLCAPDSALRLHVGSPADPDTIRTGPRVGVSGIGGDAALHPWRFWVEGEPTVSPYRRAAPRRRRNAVSGRLGA